MWIFTETGFVSAVRHYSEEGVVVVRSRDKESLKDLAARAQVDIKSSPFNDYPYRVHATDTVFQGWFLNLAQNMEYTNFKDRVYQTRGPEFAHTLMGVWEIMHDVEDAEARR